MDEEVLQQIQRLELRVAALEKRGVGAGGGGGRVRMEPATDAMLNGQGGDPVIKRDPPRWKGESCIGKTFSQCSPAYLDELAGFFEWLASKNRAEGALTANKRPKADYNERDARLARGWAQRLRDVPAPERVTDDDGQDDIPF